VAESSWFGSKGLSRNLESRKSDLTSVRSQAVRKRNGMPRLRSSFGGGIALAATHVDLQHADIDGRSFHKLKNSLGRG
jgi:hypothetical protein